MVGSGLHWAGSHQPKPARSQQQGNFPNLKRDWNEENGRFREGSAHTTQTSRSHSRVGSHVSQSQNDEQAMQQEINDLKRKLRHAQRRQPHSSPDMPSDDESDNDYRQKSRTPPNETLSHEEGHYYRRKRKSLSLSGLEAMPWAGHWINSPNHPSHAALKGLHSLGDSSSQPSPFTTTIQIPWSMWANLTKG